MAQFNLHNCALQMAVNSGALPRDVADAKAMGLAETFNKRGWGYLEGTLEGYIYEVHGSYERLAAHYLAIMGASVAQLLPNSDITA